MFAIFALALVATPSVASPANDAVQQSQPVAAERMELSTRLTDLALPDSLVLQSNMTAWENGLRAAMLNDPGVAGIEKQVPGAVQAGIDAGRPTAKPYIWSQVRKAKELRARVFAESMNEAELRQVLGFYESPLGLRLIRSLFAKADSKAMVGTVIDRANQTGELKVTEKDGQMVLRDAIRETTKTLSAEDVIAIMKFERQPVAVKMAETGRKADKLALEIFNSPDPEFLRKQREIVTDGLLAFVDSQEAGKK